VALVLWVQALLPPVLQPPREMTSAGAGVPFWIMVTLCGGRAVADPAATTLGDERKPVSKTPICPICLAAQFAGHLSLPPSVAGLAIPIEGSPVRYRHDVPLLASGSGERRPRSRSPPVPA